MKTRLIKRKILTCRQNEYGDIAIWDNKDKDKKIVHVSGKRLTVTCKAHGIDYRRCFVERKNRYGWSNNIYDGVYVDAKDHQRLLDAIEKKGLKVQKKREAGKRRIQKERQAKEAYENSLPELYADPKEALSDVCGAMFNLNRYVKDKNCHLSSEVIYSAKNDLIKYLYQNGYAYEVYNHVQHRQEKECLSCNGLGWRGDGEVCWSCEGTGIYQRERDYTYVVFRFDINGQKYTWHQPKSLISFEYETTVEAKEMPELLSQGTELSSLDLDKAILLVLWFLDNINPIKEQAA